MATVQANWFVTMRRSFQLSCPREFSVCAVRIKQTISDDRVWEVTYSSVLPITSYSLVTYKNLLSQTCPYGLSVYSVFFEFTERGTFIAAVYGINSLNGSSPSNECRKIRSDGKPKLPTKSIGTQCNVEKNTVSTQVRRTTTTTNGGSSRSRWTKRDLVIKLKDKFVSYDQFITGNHDLSECIKVYLGSKDVTRLLFGRSKVNSTLFSERRKDVESAAQEVKPTAARSHITPITFVREEAKSDPSKLITSESNSSGLHKPTPAGPVIPMHQTFYTDLDRKYQVAKLHDTRVFSAAVKCYRRIQCEKNRCLVCSGDLLPRQILRSNGISLNENELYKTLYDYLVLNDIVQSFAVRSALSGCSRYVDLKSIPITSV